MDQDYWNLEDILTESQACNESLGSLRAAAPIHRNARVELPDIVRIQQPRAFSGRVRAALNASPCSVQLRSLQPYWYALALRLAHLLDSEELRDVLSKAYMGRLPRIFELSLLLARGSAGRTSLNAADAGGADLTLELQGFLAGLDESEAHLLSVGKTASRTMQEYMTGEE
ncbi:DNA replication protein [Malassezia sp. CBS 17886]|nr:DNA replication protein [Malassezia sp. CBS 17886]